ncbi:GNAT family N-acetyltransferase [Streptomyces sp. NPDC058373]|uniref:GNAT family N-acetyltransferase n=1 Tax=Streptomyces sp. NPDC058373 TaxID=3346465 RepID=UPI00365D0B97
MIPRSYLAAMSAERDAELRVRRFAAGRAAGLRNLVAVDAAGEVVGWACCGPREAGAGGAGGRDEGELYALYVRPELLGRGIGHALLDAVHGEAAARGWGALVLWVIEANPRARGFYEASGYRADGGARSEEYDGAAVREVRYRREAGLPPAGERGRLPGWGGGGGLRDRLGARRGRPRLVGRPALTPAGACPGPPADGRRRAAPPPVAGVGGRGRWSEKCYGWQCWRCPYRWRRGGRELLAQQARLGRLGRLIEGPTSGRDDRPPRVGEAGSRGG